MHDEFAHIVAVDVWNSLGRHVGPIRFLSQPHGPMACALGGRTCYSGSLSRRLAPQRAASGSIAPSNLQWAQDDKQLGELGWEPFYNEYRRWSLIAGGTSGQVGWRRWAKSCLHTMSTCWRLLVCDSIACLLLLVNARRCTSQHALTSELRLQGWTLQVQAISTASEELVCLTISSVMLCGCSGCQLAVKTMPKV